MELSRRGIVNIGTKCNANCDHCFYAKHTSRDWKNILWIIANILLIRICRQKYIDITGGEPTIYPHIYILVKLCDVIGFDEIRIVTNASIPSVMGKLSENKKIRFSVSYHSHNVEEICSLENMFSAYKTLSNIKMFSHKINYVNCIITPHNTDIKNIACGIMKHFDKNTILCFKNLDYNFKHRIYKFPMSSYRDDLNTSIRHAVANGYKIDIRFFPFCFLDEDLITHKNIRCCSAITNNYDQMDWIPVISRSTPALRLLAFILGGNKLRKRVADKQAIIQGRSECAKTNKCLGCKYYDKCDGVQKGYLKLFGDKEFKPFLKE